MIKVPTPMDMSVELASSSRGLYHPAALRLNRWLGFVLQLWILVFAQAQPAETPAVTSTNVFGNAVAVGKDPELSLSLMSIMDDRRKLGPGDIVAYRVIEDQDEPRKLMVGDSGDLDVPYLGLMQAMDKTCKGLAHEIKTALEKDLYHQATVILNVEMVNKTRTLGKIYVAGNVRMPGAQDLPAGEVYTVSRAILKAGGFTDFANQDKVRIMRGSGSGKANKKPIEVSVKDIWSKGKRESDLALEPEDMVYVPARVVNW